MDLNTIRMLNKEQFTKIVSQRGFVELAQILSKIHFNNTGELMDVPELNTIKWKIMPQQRKQVVTFLDQLKNNPSMLKVSPSVPKNPKAQLFVSQTQAILVKKQIQTSPAPFSNEIELRKLDNSLRKNKAFTLQLEKVLGRTTNQPKSASISPQEAQQHQIHVGTIKKGKHVIPPSSEGIYCNLQPEQDDYLTPNEINDNIYSNISPTSSLKSSSGPKDYLEPSPPSKIIPTRINIQQPHHEPNDTYEPPPRVGSTKSPSLHHPIISNPGKWGSSQLLPAVQNSEEENDYSLPSEPKPLLATWEPPSRNKVSNERSKSPFQFSRPVPSQEEDDYEPAPTINYSGSSGSSIDRKPIPSPTRNVITRGTNFYENNMIRTKFTNVPKLPVNSILHRPLPQIPSSDPVASLLPVHPKVEYERKISSSSTISNHSSHEINPVYVEMTRNYTANYEDGGDPIYGNEPDSFSDKEPLLYGNVPPNKPSVVVVTAQREPETDHNQWQNNKNLKKDIKVDNLAQQLSAELSRRKLQTETIVDPKGNLPDFNTRPRNTSPSTLLKRSLPSLPKPPASTVLPPVIHSFSQPPDDDDDDDDSDSSYIGSIFEAVETNPYYRNTDRKGAKSLLRKFEDGAFLFRPSQHHFLVLTVKYKNNKFYNFGIERTENGQIKLDSDNSSTPPEFSSLRSFIDHFKKEAVSFQDGDKLIEIHLKTVLTPDMY